MSAALQLVLSSTAGQRHGERENMTTDRVVDIDEIVINNGHATLTSKGVDQLAAFNLAWIRKQPKPERVSKYLQKKRRQARERRR
jgi:hypothetical protein